MGGLLIAWKWTRDHAKKETAPEYPGNSESNR